VDIIYRIDPYQPLKRVGRGGPDAALKALTDGNARFAGTCDAVRREMLGEKGDDRVVIVADPMELGFPIWGDASPVQAPFALVLGCSDARVPTELIFDQASNALFVVRVAGNILGLEGLGSIAYASRHLGKSLQVVVVLGHRHCGAVTAAVDTYLSYKDYADIAFTHALRTLIDHILIAVRGASRAIQQECGPGITDHPEYRSALVEVAVYLNSALTAFDLRRELDMLGNGGLRVAYGVFDLVSQQVGPVPPPPQGQDGGPAFGNAPQEADELLELGARVVRAVRARGMLA
jgi:carbonic anhydrase